MSSYLTSILTAFIIFPVLAFILTLPYMIIQYHKYGAISKKKVLIVFSFIFYLLCVYFLVILPLPKISDVKNYTGRWYNMKLFTFIKEIKNTPHFDPNNLTTYLTLITSNRILEPLFNLFLMIPFGIYLRYYFKKGWFTTILYTFIFSLFLEITQLTGLYYIYPRPYRMFDVNDLLINTTGGFLGFIIAPIFTFFLPTPEQLDEEVLRKGRRVTFSRRLVGYIIDITIINIIFLILRNHLNYLGQFIIIIAYFSLNLILFKNRTIGKAIVRIKLTKTNIGKNILRSILFEGLFLNGYLLFAFLKVPLLYCILIQLACYFFLLFNCFAEKYYNKDNLLIDKILKIKITDTIKHQETYIMKL